MVPRWVIPLCAVVFLIFVNAAAASPLPASAEEDKPYVNETVTTLKVSIVTEKEIVQVTTPVVETTVLPESSNGTTIPDEGAVDYDRPDNEEGGKAEEPQNNVDTKKIPIEPPVQVGEGEAREDNEPNNVDSLNKLVEDAKGNSGNSLNLPPERQVRYEEAPESNFLTFLMVATLLVVCIYIIQHNKKKILGFVFEGKTGRNVRYRRLSQHDDREDIIY